MHVFDLLLCYLAPSLCVGQHPRWSQQLHAVSQTSVRADFAQVGQCLGRELDVLSGGSDRQDLHELFKAVVGGLDDQQSIEQVDWYTMGRGHVSSPYSANASIGGQYNNRRKSGLQCPIQEGKAFNVQHMHLIDEQHSWHQLSNTLIDIPIDYLIYLRSQLLSHFSFLWFHDLAHKTHEVVSALGTGVGHVEIMQGHILHNFFLLVDITLRQRDVLLGLKIEFTRIGIASSHPLYIACRCLDVNHIADRTFFPCEVLMNGRIELKLFCSFGGLEGDYDANDDLIA